jgi:capsular exopolysaccharide synthesis family protein
LNITRQQVVKNGLYTFLLEKREEAAIQYSATLGDVQVLQAASANYSPVSPKVGRTYGLALFFGLSVVALVLFLRQWFNYKLQYRSEIERVTNIPVLEEIVQVESESPLVMKDGNRTLIAEQFRSLRTNLGYFKTATPDKCKVLVSSSIPGEGKSFISTNLAISYSLAGLKTVLIESDLRKPNVAKHFEISKRLGLSNYLSGNASMAEVTFESGMANLWVIPSGPIPPNPSELITGSTRYGDLLEGLIKDYDRIVIDCPPVGLVTDAQLLCDYVDISLFVCRQDHTPKAALANLLNPLYESGKFWQMGLVFNGLNQQAKGYGYGYG